MAKNINQIRNFSELLTNYGVQIPLIQRDYVQGRVHDTKPFEGKGDDKSKELLKKYTKERERRDNFVKQLLDALENPISSKMQLTFIYGTCVPTSTNATKHTESLIPLDGQQRLTTLFLLTWILIHKQAKADRLTFEKMNTFQELQKGMRSFSYKTRPSSGTFCESLVTEVLIPVEGSISIKIKSQPWFGDDWNQDPSVKAMLQILDEMELKLNGRNVKYMLDNLLQGAGIEFDLLDMQDFKLTDSLYIKMNARGKQLTEFENWKSEFIDFLEDNYNTQCYNGYVDPNIINSVFCGTNPSIKDYFSYSIEHQWTDLFWEYCIEDIKTHQLQLTQINNPTKTNKDCYPVIDNYFMSVFEKLTQIFFFVTNPSKKQASDYSLSKENNDSIYSQKNNVENLFSFLDILCKLNDAWFDSVFYIAKDNQLTLNSGKVRLFEEKEITNLLTRCAKQEGASDSLNVLLYGILIYIKEYGDTVDDDLKSFVRSLRNCIESKSYLQTKEARMVNDFNANDISSKSVKAKIDDLLKEKKSTGKLTRVSNEEAAVQDFDFIRGNTKLQFKSSWVDTYMAIKAWDALDNLQKVQLLIAYGFRGHYVMTCGHGELKLFGTENHWLPIFVHDDNRGNGDIETALNNIIIDYKKVVGPTGMLQLLANKKNIQRQFDFCYYALTYDGLLNACAFSKTPKFYFSIQGKIDEMNICAMQYSSKPTMAYHTDPIIHAVKEELIGQTKYNSGKTMYLGYSITGSKRAFLYVYNTKPWDGIDPIAEIRHNSGTFGNGGWEVVKPFNMMRTIPDTNGKNRVKAGVDLLNTLFPNTDFAIKG